MIRILRTGLARAADACATSGVSTQTLDITGQAEPTTALEMSSLSDRPVTRTEIVGVHRFGVGNN